MELKLKVNPMTLGPKRSRKGGGVAKYKLAKKSSYTPKLSAAAKRLLKELE